MAPKVILRDCPSYDPQAIQRMVLEAMDALGLEPHGKTLVKPNLVAAGDLFKHAHTRPEVVEGILGALRARGGRISELKVGERCGITIPSRYAFEHSGFTAMLERLGVAHSYFEEERQVEVRLTHEGRLRDYLFTPEPVAQADFFVNVPKFKSHPWTTVTFSMKNYIGIQDDRHRLIDHDHRLNQKVADLQYVIQPQLVVIDAVIAGESRMLTPIPRELRLLVLGNNQPAVDAVCCHIIGVDPATVEHIRLAADRGFGPIDLAQIALSGDVSLEQAQERARGFRVGLVRVEKYFEGTNITAYAGPPPEPEHTDYCWGGCPGAIEEAIEILRLFDESTDRKMPRLHVVFGAYDGPIDAGPGEKVIFIGDCASWKGRLGGKDVKIDSVYEARHTKDPYEAQHDDIYAKIATVTAKWAASTGTQVLRLKGCPVSVAEQLFVLATASGAQNPVFDKREIFRFNKAYAAWRAKTATMRLRGHRYQEKGEAPRGKARPPQS